MLSLFMFFFFQAEDGIRDDLVTGVQTCALPIYGGDIGQEGVGHEEATVGVDPARVVVGISEVRRIARHQEKNECRDLNDHIGESQDTRPPTPIPRVHGSSLRNATNNAQPVWTPMPCCRWPA